VTLPSYPVHLAHFMCANGPATVIYSTTDWIFRPGHCCSL
jgi:hypothetical protein